jgi:hypothetical protein
VKAWTTANVSGRCAYDFTHAWRAGARVFILQGEGWRKTYCATCAQQRHNAPEDTGELLEVESLPQYPAQLLEFSGVTRGLFDAKAAAANDGAE